MSTPSYSELRKRRDHLRGLAHPIYATSVDEDRRHQVTDHHLTQLAAYEAELVEVEAAMQAALAAEPLASA